LFCFRGANIGQKNDSANFSSKKCKKMIISLVLPCFWDFEGLFRAKNQAPQRKPAI
jgi:hypothetical protein